jgi:hypothetical protein
MLYRASPVEVQRPPTVQRIRDLPAFLSAPPADERTTLPSIEEISRPSSTSTQGSAVLQHPTTLPALPGLSALASVAAAPSPPPRSVLTPSIGRPTFNLPVPRLLGALYCSLSNIRLAHRAFHIGQNMAYATTSPAAMAAGQGNSPVREPLLP